MLLRKLNENGIAEFKNYINKLSTDGSTNLPVWLLEHKDTSEPINKDIEIEDNEFKSRYEMGEYLNTKFKGMDIQSYIGDEGMWNWLALYWFDQLCPKDKEGKRHPRVIYNYILSKDFGRRQRHAIFMTWQLVSKHGAGVKYLLSKNMSVRGELMEQFMGTQYILTTDSVIALASKLYNNPDTGSFKRGAASKGAGTSRRFTKFLNQINLTYDLDTISAENLEDLLPREYDRFR